MSFVGARYRVPDIPIAIISTGICASTLIPQVLVKRNNWSGLLY